MSGEGVMKVKIAKWGNSPAIKVPRRYADDLGLKPGSTGK
jgi:antitoxin component of MazEF toxin-antitoxin module